MSAVRIVMILCCLVTMAAAQDTIALGNKRCIDGRPVDAGLDPVSIRVGDQTYSIRVASQENAEAIRKMRPEAALRAVVGFNRELSDRVNLPSETPKP